MSSPADAIHLTADTPGARLGSDLDPRLDLLPKLYQRSVWPKVKQVAQGKALPAPLIVDLDPTTFCDLACPECISGMLLNKGRFSDERLEDLATEMVEAGVVGVILIGGGEPLAHPGTARVLRTFGEAGVKIGLVTNGTQIPRHEKMLAEYASWVRVSIDAGTSDTYKRFRPDRRGRSRFDQVIGNMRSFALQLKGDLGYSFLLMERTNSSGEVTDSNFSEVERAGILAKEIGCRYFEVKAMFDEGHFIVGRGASQINLLREQLDALRGITTDTFAVLGSSTLEALMEEAPRTQTKSYSRCNVAELRTLLTPTGSYICPYHRGSPKARLGDPVTESFGAIWDRNERSKIDPSVDCQFHCARHDQNLAIEEAGLRPAGQQVIPDFDLFI